MKIKLMKAFSSLFALFLISFVLTACGGSGSDSSEADVETADESMDITVAGGSSGGAWNVIGEGLGSSIKKEYPGTQFTYQPGQDGANVLSITQGKVPFALVTSEAANLAFNGKEPFNEKIEDFRAIAYINSMPYHFMVTKDSGIDSIEQIVEEKIPYRAAVSTERSIFEITSKVVLDSYGTDYEQIEDNGGKIHLIAPSGAVDLVKDRKMDGFMTPLPVPASYVEELNTSIPLNILPLSDNAIKQMKDELGAEPSVIKADEYSFLEEDIPTASAKTVLIASADVSDETVYKMTKAIYEDLENLRNVHKSFEDMTEDTITDISTIPFHDGAIEFYEEVGAME